MLIVSPSFPPHATVLAMLTTDSDSWVEKVLVLTSDSRTLVGTLLSCDQMTNLVRPVPFRDPLLFIFAAIRYLLEA